MAISVFPPKFPQKNLETLTSGSSWTVPSGVTKVIVTTMSGGGGGGPGTGSSPASTGIPGRNGEIRVSTVTTTPGASIAYSIGAGGAGYIAVGNIPAQVGGSTTFTGATTASGTSTGYMNVNAGSVTTASNGVAGYAGMITLEYWV